MVRDLMCVSLTWELHGWHYIHQLGHLDVNATPFVHVGTQLDSLEATLESAILLKTAGNQTLIHI